MGGAQRYPSMPVCVVMGIAALHPSYENALSPSRDADRPRFVINFPPSLSEGAGKTGCTLHPRSRVPFALKRMHTSIQVRREHPGLACAMALRFTSSFPVNGFLATVAARKTFAQLSASTAAS